MQCKTCGGEMIERSRARLATVGALMLAAVTLAFYFPALWPAGIILALTGLYLLTWATLGRGRWCRNCKRFSLS